RSWSRRAAAKDFPSCAARCGRRPRSRRCRGRRERARVLGHGRAGVMATRDSGSATTLLEYRTELAAPVERVFAALTEAPHIARWLSDEAESDAAPGGRVVLTWRREGSSAQPFTARWVVFQPPTSCAFEGGHAGYPDGYGGRIGFELAARGGA